MDVKSQVGSFLVKLLILAAGGGGIWFIGWPEAPLQEGEGGLNEYEIVRRESFSQPNAASLVDRTRFPDLLGTEIIRVAEPPRTPSLEPSQRERRIEPKAGIILDVNEATQDDLERLPGVGPTLAKRIIGYRETNGPFQHFDELERVAGIGRKRLEQLRHLVTVKSRKA